MITIKHNKKPILPSCEMLCDKKLHPKLEAYELTKFLNMHSTNLIVGKPGSGKTSMAISMITQRKNKIYKTDSLSLQPKK